MIVRATAKIASAVAQELGVSFKHSQINLSQAFGLLDSAKWTKVNGPTSNDSLGHRALLRYPNN